MQVTTAIKKMIDFYEGNIHDIDHFMRYGHWQRPLVKKKDSTIRHRKF